MSGILPKGWRTAKLGELADVQSGGTPPVSKSTYWNGDVPWYSSGELNDVYTSSPKRRISQLGLQNSNAKLFPTGSLLIGMYDTAALKMSLLDRDGAFNQAIAGVKPSDKLDLLFAIHAISAIKSKLLLQRQGVRQKNLSLEKIRGIELSLPSVREQRRIVEVLDRAEALRAKRRAALAQLDALTQSLFLDLFGDPKSNPKAWPHKAMTELFATSPIFGSMIPPVAEKCGWLSLRVGNIQDWTLDLSDSKYVDLPAASVERHSVKDGDLLLARAIASQDHLGKCVIAHPNGEQWAFDSHLMRLRFDQKHTEPEFIRHLFMTPGGRRLFLKASRKSTVQFNINTKEISALQIPVPPIPLQREFARRVTAVEALKTAQRASLAELDALFATLQHRAFRGELSS